MQDFRRRRGPVLAVLTTVAILLAGCAAQRDLPEQPPLDELQSIDLCALAPDDEVNAEVSDVLGSGEMRRTLGQCWFTSPAGSFWMSLANDADDLPASVREESDDVAVEKGEHGIILDTRPFDGDRCGSRTLVSDTGYIIDVSHGTSATPAECDIVKDLSRLVLRNLGEDVPSIDWPADSVARADLCTAVHDHDVAGALDISEEMVVQSANRFDCRIGTATEEVDLSFDTRVSAVEGTEPEHVEVGGRPALSTEDGCVLAIDLGENSVLAERVKDGRDALDVSTHSTAFDCADLPNALDGLVRELAH